jgi:hypothetical protein
MAASGFKRLVEITRVVRVPTEVDEFREFIRLAYRYHDTRPVDQLFLVPIEKADRFSYLLKKFISPYYSQRRVARGPRPGTGGLYGDKPGFTLKKNAHSFGYYLHRKYHAWRHIEVLEEDSAIWYSAALKDL